MAGLSVCLSVYLCDIFSALSFVHQAPGADVWVEGVERHPLQGSPPPPTQPDPYYLVFGRLFLDDLGC